LAFSALTTCCSGCTCYSIRAFHNLKPQTGDAQTGWDTDQFLTDPRMATLVMAVVVKNGGLGTGGINFDAKIR
jgi:xylose isomerase